MEELNITVTMEELDAILLALDIFQNEDNEEKKVFLDNLLDKLADVYNK